MKNERGEKSSVTIDTPQFNLLIRSIRDLIKVFAAAQIRRDQGTEKNARFLKVFGLSETEIADLLGVSQPAVNQALSKGKKKQRKRKEAKDDTSESASG